MKILTERPPCFEDALKAFKFDENKTVFAYGDVIYNPGNIVIDQHLLAHETVHAKQQNFDPTVAKLWWMRYIEDPKFRLEQEIEAYGAQYASICKAVRDKNQRFKNLHMLAEFLASPLYGSIIGITEATRKIKVASGMDKK